MHVPLLMRCGHSSCYHCLYSWFKVKMNCPTCRVESDEKPILNVPLKQISQTMTDLLIDITEDREEREAIINHRKDAVNEYMQDAENKALFGALFSSAVTLIDRSDGVPRCGNCHWEAHGTVCLYCGSSFRRSRIDYSDLEEYDDDEEEDGEEQEETENYGTTVENAYDSEDSFIDDSAPEVYSNSDLSSSDAEFLGRSEWRGFENDHDLDVTGISSDRSQSSSSVVDMSNDPNGDYERDVNRTIRNFRSALDENDSDDTDEIIRRRPRGVIDISDEE